jgi:DNA-binding FrmR family transcriptional regulator
METRSPELKNALNVRLRRIEGQVRGVLRMIEEDRDCPEILQQMSAIRSALQQSSLMVARAYAIRYLKESDASASDAAIDTLIAMLGKLE